MRIDNPQLSQVSTSALQQQTGAGEVQGRPGQRGQSTEGSDSVQLSHLGSSLRDLAAEDPDRAKSVQSIAAAVETGSYAVDAAALSRKIVQEFTTA